MTDIASTANNGAGMVRCDGIFPWCSGLAHICLLGLLRSRKEGVLSWLLYSFSNADADAVPAVTGDRMLIPFRFCADTPVLWRC